MKMKNEKTYWNHKGKYQKLADRLHELIPPIGSVSNPLKNKELERFRLAGNAYYDLFNNGLINRASEFRKVFGFAGTWIAKERFPYCQKLEDKMDEIILLASKEQGIE
jgi:hypothetical protein